MKLILIIFTAFIADGPVRFADDVTLQQEAPLRVGPKTNRASLEDIANARQKMETTKDHFERIKALAERGSISQSRLQRSNLEMRLAELELDSLQNPSSAKRNRRMIANLNLEFAKNEFGRSKKLFASGSVSELEYRRDLYRLKYAQIARKEAIGEISGDVAKFQTTEQQLKLATIEFDLGKRLFTKKAISRPTLRLLQERMQEVAKEFEKLKQQQEQKKQKLDQRRKT